MSTGSKGGRPPLRISRFSYPKSFSMSLRNSSQSITPLSLFTLFTVPVISFLWSRTLNKSDAFFGVRYFILKLYIITTNRKVYRGGILGGAEGPLVSLSSHEKSFGIQYGPVRTASLDCTSNQRPSSLARNPSNASRCAGASAIFVS